MAPRTEPPEDWQVKYVTILERTCHLFHSQDWADCTFVFPTDSEADTVSSKNTLKAHKLILAMASPVFAAMFYGNLGDKESPVIIRDIDLPTFSTLLEYIYTDQYSTPTIEVTMAIYKAANKYLLVPLAEECINELIEDMTPDNVCQMYEFACFYREKSLEEKCVELFSTKTQFVLKGSSFLEFAEANTLKKIVSMDTLDIKSEIDLFNALVHYVDHFEKHDINHNVVTEPNHVEQDCEKPKNHEHDYCRALDLDSHCSLKTPDEARKILKGVIEQIRFLSLPPEDLSEICKSTILSEKEKLSLLTNVSSPNSSLPMPDGFSCIREPRMRGSATVQHTVPQVSTLLIYMEQDVSEICYVRNLPWRVDVARDSESRYHTYHDTCLLVLLTLKEDSLPDDWTCKVTGRVEILRYEKPDIPFNYKYDENINKFDVTFSKRNRSHEILSFDWQELFQPKQKLIRDDSITVEVHFTTQPSIC